VSGIGTTSSTAAITQTTSANMRGPGTSTGRVAPATATSPVPSPRRTAPSPRRTSWERRSPVPRPGLAATLCRGCLQWP